MEYRHRAGHFRTVPAVVCLLVALIGFGTPAAGRSSKDLRLAYLDFSARQDIVTVDPSLGHGNGGNGGGPPEQITTDGEVLQLRWSPAGNLFAIMSPENTIVVMEPDGSDPRIVATDDASLGEFYPTVTGWRWCATPTATTTSGSSTSSGADSCGGDVRATASRRISSGPLMARSWRSTAPTARAAPVAATRRSSSSTPTARPATPSPSAPIPRGHPTTSSSPSPARSARCASCQPPEARPTRSPPVRWAPRRCSPGSPKET